MTTYTNIPGSWIETIPRTKSILASSIVVNATALEINAANESVTLTGYLMITGNATNVAFDTNSKIIWRTGTGNVFTNATSVLTIGVQDTDLTNGPPARGDGTYDVYGTYASALSNSTLMSTAMTSGSKNLSHGQQISIKIEFTTFTTADTVRIQSLTSENAGPFQTVASNLNNASTAAIPTPFILDFEGDMSVLGVFDTGWPQMESFGSFINYGSGVEHGMAFKTGANMKVNGFWLASAMSDAITGDYIFYTDPFGTPSGTTLATMDGDAITSSATRGNPVWCQPIELVPSTWYGYVLKSSGSSCLVQPWAASNANQIGQFCGFGTDDVRITRTGGSGAFTAVSGEYHFWGAHLCAIPSASQGGSLAANPMRGFIG